MENQSQCGAEMSIPNDPKRDDESAAEYSDDESETDLEDIFDINFLQAEEEDAESGAGEVFLLRETTEKAHPELPPEELDPAPRLVQDLQTFKRLAESETPIMVPVRPTKTIKLVYGFGDASGEGLGSGVRVFTGKGIRDQVGENLSTTLTDG